MRRARWAAIAAQLSPDGALYLGGAESVLGLTQAFKPVEGMRGVYGRTGGAAAAPAANPGATMQRAG